MNKTCVCFETGTFVNKVLADLSKRCECGCLKLSVMQSQAHYINIVVYFCSFDRSYVFFILHYVI